MEPDLTNAYNTQLTPSQESSFQSWQKDNPGLGNTYDYDSRGFWLNGASQSDNGHGADTWKKPNHPTFSDQSMYHGVDGQYGGTWQKQSDESYNFYPSETNMQMYSPDRLSDYFGKVEKGNSVIFPP
jgi:hypothetical protein